MKIKGEGLMDYAFLKWLASSPGLLEGLILIKLEFTATGTSDHSNNLQSLVSVIKLRVLLANFKELYFYVVSEWPWVFVMSFKPSVVHWQFRINLESHPNKRTLTYCLANDLQLKWSDTAIVESWQHQLMDRRAFSSIICKKQMKTHVNCLYYWIGYSI